MTHRLTFDLPRWASKNITRHGKSILIVWLLHVPLHPKSLLFKTFKCRDMFWLRYGFDYTVQSSCSQVSSGPGFLLCTKIQVFPKGYSEFHLLGPTDSSYKYHLEAFYIASEYKYNAHIMNCTHFLFQFSCFLNARFLRCRWLEESVTRLGDWLWLMKGSRTPGDWSKLSLHVNRGCVGM